MMIRSITQGRCGKVWRTLCIALSVALAAYSQVSPLSVFAASSLDDGIRELSSAIVPQVRKLGQKRIAVVDFSDLQGRVTSLGRFVADELSAALAISGTGLRVVDRQHLARIIQEQKLAIYGITDPLAVRRLGQLAGADALVTGSITDLVDRVRITAKVLSTSTADIVGAAQTTIPRSQDVVRLLGSGTTQPTTPGASAPALPRVTYLSELSAVSGQPSHEQAVLFGVPYRRALVGDTCRSGDTSWSVVYNLGKNYDRFEAVAGVADNQGTREWVVFQVVGDGNVLFESRRLRSGEIPADIKVPVRGILRFELISSSVDVCVQIVWGDPRVIRQ